MAFDQEPPSPERRAFKIEIIRSPEGAEVSFSPERGGIITSLVLGGKELLYMDWETFRNPDVNVRGGIPILFPNAGAVKGLPETNPHSQLKQHGLARRSSAWIAHRTERGFGEILSADATTFPEYPHAFELAVEGVLEPDGSFTLSQDVVNTGHADMPVTMGDHGYFKVEHTDKDKIVFDFAGGETIRTAMDHWMNDGTVTARNPGTPLRIRLPGLGTLTITMSPEYDRLWVWSMKGGDFVCLENVTGEDGDFVNNPRILRPGGILSARVNFQLAAERASS